MMRIGDFSKFSRVSIKTLRFYDEMDLLKPIQVDHFTGYRYYEYEQLLRINHILALRDLNFSLEEIGQLLKDGLTADQMLGMYQLRRAEIRQRIEEETSRLTRIETRLKQILQEEDMSKYDVVIKKIEPLKVITIRGVVPTPPEQGSLWHELGDYLAKLNVQLMGGPCFSLYHDDEYKERDWDIEVCEPIDAEVPETDRVKVRILPAVETMACTIHHGSFLTIGEAYNSMMKWMETNGYRIIGPCRELYLRTAKDGNQDDLSTVTEIQFPVEET